MMHTHDELGEDERPSFYVILAPEREDFLSLYQVLQGQALVGWDEDPEKAVRAVCASVRSNRVSAVLEPSPRVLS